jgi:hypothetical protein
MGNWELAQFNVARAVDALDSPALAGFMAELKRVNELADVAAGFVWRYEGSSADAPAASADDDPRLLLNLSVWRSVEALYDYTYRGDHAKQIGRRREWFEPTREAQLVLWWVPIGHRPTLAEGKARLQQLRAHGPTPEAFTFKQRFAAPDGPAV